MHRDFMVLQRQITCFDRDDMQSMGQFGQQALNVNVPNACITIKFMAF